MKSSTLLHLFFISIGLPLTCASLTPKPKTGALVLRDTSNNAPVVQLKRQGSLVQSIPMESQVSEKDELIKKFEEPISKGRYAEIAKLADKMGDEELSKCLCQVVTELEHFEGLYEYLKQRYMIPGFLAHGEMVLIRRVIVETDLLETDQDSRCDDIYDAIASSLEKDRHERVVGLFEAAKGRPGWKFGQFVKGFFERYSPERNGMPLKRFFTLHGEELNKKHHAIFETICENMVGALRWLPDNLGSQLSLTDLVGQHSLLSPVAFARGFLHDTDDGILHANFVKYGYKEAIDEGLKEEYLGGGRDLWEVMVNQFPNQFSGDYPDTDETRAAVLKDFKPTKRDREEEWALANAPNLQMKLEILVPSILPTTPLGIVAEYAVTWIAFFWSPPQNQPRILVSEQVAEKFKTLMSEERYGEVVELGSSMQNGVLAEYLFPLMTTTDHCKHLNGYLNSRRMLPDFLMLGDIGIVKKAILEIENTGSDYYILHEHMFEAITFSIKEDRHDRAINLLRVERERHATTDEQCKLTGRKSKFEVLLSNFSRRLVTLRNTAPVKRFVTIYKEELDEGWPNIFEFMCQGMISRFKTDLNRPELRKLLTDFVGQSSLITATAFANGFLERNNNQSDFINYSWREALEEGLKEKYPSGGKKLWAMMVSKYSDKFSGAYPSTDEARTDALKDFKPTKRDLEEAWANENAPIFAKQLEKLITGFPLYRDLLSIIAGYSVTWVVV